MNIQSHSVSFSKADSLSDAAHLEMHEPPSQRMGLLTPPGFQEQIPLYFSAKQVCDTSRYEIDELPGTIIGCHYCGSSSHNSAAEDAYTCPGGVWFVRGGGGFVRGVSGGGLVCSGGGGGVSGGWTTPRTLSSEAPPHTPQTSGPPPQTRHTWIFAATPAEAPVDVFLDCLYF